MIKFICLLMLTTLGNAQHIQFPLKAGPGKKYLVDQNTRPVFLNGCASWRLSYNVTLKEAKIFLDDRKAQGYNTLIVEITPDLANEKGGDQPNIYGEHTFFEKDVSKPNEKYFLHVDSILRLCNEMNFAVLLFPLYLGCCHDGWLEIMQQQPNTVQKCRDYGVWVANRYKNLPNIIWVSGGDHNETPEAIAFAEGIAATDTAHLHSYHSGPGNTSTERLPGAKWLTLSCTYTYFPAMDSYWQYEHVYSQLFHESLRNKTMPFIMSESAYEYERDETTQFIRRQAYWAVLSGAGGHIFGNRDIWMMNNKWPGALHTPGNKSIQIFYSFIQTIPWYDMKPDWSHTLFTSGRGAFNATNNPGGDEYATGAFSRDSATAVLYMPTYRVVCVNMERFRGKVVAKWFDPTTGTYIIESKQSENTGVAYYKPPSFKNIKGFDDWVLVLTAK